MKTDRFILCESIVKRSLPRNYQVCDENLFSHELEKRIPGTSLQIERNITILPDGMLFHGITPHLQSFPENGMISDWTKFARKIKYYVKNRLLRYVEKIDEAVIITDIWSYGYYHWLSDALTRLVAVKEEIHDITLVLPNGYLENEYIASSLKAFSLNSVIYSKGICLVKKAIIPSHTAPTGNYNIELVNKLRATFYEFFMNCSSSQFGDRIYISRAKANKRKIINEDECMSVLGKYGFAVVCFEAMSFEEQVKTAMNATFLVSNHGAGLTNILFMRKGTSVFELRKQKDDLNNCYFSLASALGVNYYYQTCASDSSDDAHSANIYVDCRELEKNLEVMIVNRQI